MDLDFSIKIEENDSYYWETRLRPNRVYKLDDKKFNKNVKRSMDYNFDIHYLRMQTPLLKILFSEYKIKWEKTQRRRFAREKKIALEESDYLSDTSNGSVTSNIAFGYPNAEIDDDIETLSMDTECFRAGYYLLLSYEKGGWTYPEVKRYFREKHGVRCFRSKIINDALKGTNHFRALVKFRNRKALDDVCKILAKEGM